MEVLYQQGREIIALGRSDPAVARQSSVGHGDRSFRRQRIGVLGLAPFNFAGREHPHTTSLLPVWLRFRHLQFSPTRGRQPTYLWKRVPTSS